MQDATEVTGITTTGHGDTYAVDYGRIVGADWMARSTSWYAPEETQIEEEDEMNEFGDGTRALADRVSGSEDAWDGADAIAVARVATWTQAQPALNTIAKVGLTAIVELSRTNPDLARSLADELAR